MNADKGLIHTLKDLKCLATFSFFNADNMGCAAWLFKIVSVISATSDMTTHDLGTPE
jgi:hypothetical protein